MDNSHSYQYCGNRRHPINATLTATHSILYKGPPVMVCRLLYRTTDLVIQKAKVNTSTSIRHLTGTFQRIIEIDATEQPLYITFSVRRFTGHTDKCKHGGLRMYHTVSMAIPINDGNIYYAAYVPYDSKEHTTLNESTDQHAYHSICTNQSFIFKNNFYLDFGKINLLFFGYRSQFEIDVTLRVYPSTYISVFDFEDRYCIKRSVLYIFKSFIINCDKMIIELKQQVPFLLQWSGSKTNSRIQSQYLEWFWPERMKMTIKLHYFPYYVKQYSTDSTTSPYCIQSDIFHITTPQRVEKIVLSSENKIPIIHKANTKSLSISLRRDPCRFIAVLQYSVFLDPTPGGTRCPRSKASFLSDTFRGYYQVLQKCISLDMIYQRGNNMLYILGSKHRYPYVDNWVYYYLKIDEKCFRSKSIIIYYTTSAKNYRRTEHFELTTEKSQFMFYDYAFAQKLQFTLIRSLTCTGYIHITEVTAQPKLLSFIKMLKVCFGFIS